MCCGQISCCQTGLLRVAAWSQTMKGNLLVQFKVPFSKANLPYCSGGQQYRLWLNWPSPSSVWVCVSVSWMVERGLSLDRWRLERLETKLLHSGDFLTCHSRVNNTFSVLFHFKGSQTAWTTQTLKLKKTDKLQSGVILTAKKKKKICSLSKKKGPAINFSSVKFLFPHLFSCFKRLNTISCSAIWSKHIIT